MPMKNLSVRRPLWSSTQKFRHSQDSRSMLAIPVDGGKGEKCSGGIERREREREGRRGEGGDEKRPCRPGVTKGWIWIWRVAQRGRRGWKDWRLVEQLASRQWHSGWQEPYNLLPPPPLSSPSPISSLHPPTVPMCVYSYALLSWQEKPTRVTPN